MFTEWRGGDICGGERGGPPVCQLHAEQTKMSLPHLTANLHEPESVMPVDPLLKPSLFSAGNTSLRKPTKAMVLFEHLL